MNETVDQAKRTLKRADVTQQHFETLPRVRVRNAYGPCYMRYRIWRQHKRTYTLVAWRQYDNKPVYESIYHGLVHTEPCPCCPVEVTP